MNHGLITHGDDARSALALTLKTSKFIQSYLKTKQVRESFRVMRRPAHFSRHLVPDSVVYAQVDFRKLPQKKKTVFYEMSSMTNFILKSIHIIGGRPSFLDTGDVRFVVGMDKEKKRIESLVRGGA